MSYKKWAARIGFGALIYYTSAVFMGISSVGGIAMEILSIIIIGVVGMWIAKKLINSFWKEKGGGVHDGTERRSEKNSRSITERK